MIDAWLDLPIGGIFLTLALVYGLTAFAIHWASFHPPFKGLMHATRGIVPTYLSAIGVLSALLIGFLANDISDRNHRATRTVLTEGNALIALDALSRVSDKMPPELHQAMRHYAFSALTDEWARMSHGATSETTARALDRLAQIVASPEVGHIAGPTLQASLLQATLAVGNARAERLALNSDHSNEIKWASVLILSLLTMVAIGFVHLEKPRAQAMALGLYAVSVVIALGLIGIQEYPFDGPTRVTPKPIEAAIKIMDRGRTASGLASGG